MTDDDLDLRVWVVQEAHPCTVWACAGPPGQAGDRHEYVATAATHELAAQIVAEHNAEKVRGPVLAIGPLPCPRCATPLVWCSPDAFANLPPTWWEGDLDSVRAPHSRCDPATDDGEMARLRAENAALRADVDRIVELAALDAINPHTGERRDYNPMTGAIRDVLIRSGWTPPPTEDQ